MAQLKVKQISDFVAAVGTIHNATVGTAAGTAIGVNATAIASNVANISANATAISSNAGDIATNAGDIATNATAISANAGKIATNVTNIATNASAIATNAEGIATNAEGISANASEISRVDGRVTTLLGGSTEALDTFGEIKTFIDGLAAADVTVFDAISTAVSNDKVHSDDISANATAISNLDTAAKGYADTAEANAIAHADGLAVNYATADQGLLADSALQSYGDLGLTVTSEELDQLAGVVVGDILTSNVRDFDGAGSASAAQTAAIASAESKDVARASAAATALSNAIAQEVLDRDAAILVLDNDLQSQITALSGVNSDEVIATFVDVRSFDAGKVFNLNGGHVAVFVNGLQIHEAAEGVDGWSSENGQVFTVAGLGYDLESDDHIVVSGTLA